MIVDDLGYCCPWFFFVHYRQTALIAARLGVTPRAVRYAKAKILSQPHGCADRKTCMNRLITRTGDPRKIALPNQPTQVTPKSQSDSS